ncbi:hypothetical protein [Desertibaculum subflavum]|uniref:VirB4 family type IV secretion/conjugal transfer ATPase n=1 Tax=Desertibaculum subflavum TaxID=2268458 RepID=UPI0013C4659D
MSAATAALLNAGPAQAAALKTASPDWVQSAAALGVGLLAASAATALAVSPVVRRLVLPPPEETELRHILQFEAVLDDGRTIRTREGALVQTIALRGIDYSSKTEPERRALFVKRHAWLMKLCEAGAEAKLLTLRTRVSVDAPAQYENAALQEIHDRWMRSFDEAYVNRHYVVLTVRGEKAPEKRLGELVQSVLEGLHDYAPEVLSNGTGAHSPLNSFWARLVNGFPTPLPSFTTDLAERLCVATLTFGRDSGLIEYRDGLETRLALAISVRSWGDTDSGELVDRLLAVDGEIEICQLLRGVPKAKAQTWLPWASRQANMPIPNSFRTAEFEAALELIAGDKDGLVEHQLTVFVQAGTEERLQALSAEVRRLLADFGIRAVTEGAAVEWLWRCRLPGFDLPTRPRALLAQNIASLNSFNDEPQGLDRSDWGEGALRLFKTIGGAAYSLQLHSTAEKEALAHSVTFAPAGSGKTTLFEHLIGGALRHRELAAYAFDRNFGLNVFTEAVGGTYLNLSQGTDETGEVHVRLNPLQCADNHQNRLFLRSWLLQLGGVDDDASYEVAGRAIDAIFKIRKVGSRSLTSVFDGAFDTGSALKAGLARWVGTEGAAGWFNGATDSLNLDTARLVTFDMTDAFRDPRAAAALVSYIMFRIRSVCARDARPHLVFIDETAPMLEDEIFRKNVEVLFREHRKLRGSVNIVFQDVGALLRSGIAEMVFNNCPTQFIFQNPNAREEDYRALELTPAQWDYVKGTSRLGRSLRRSVLVKRGREAVILDIDLSALGPYLKIYRSGIEPVNLMHFLKLKYGADRWLAEYIEHG